MQCPAFEILKYGVHDSNVVTPKLTVTKERCAIRYEVELITSEDDGISYMNGKAYSHQPGLFLCAKPGTLRYSRLPLRCHYVHLLTEDAELKRILQQLPDACRFSDHGPIAKLFQEIAELPESDDVADKLYLQSLVLKLLSVLYRTAQVEVRGEELVSSTHRAILMETDKYIRDHLSSPLSLEILAERANFSPAHFHRVFTAYFGKTPHEFVMDCRIDAARAALQADSCTLSDLAAGCGFSSHSYFSHLFKKATGLTPLQYRRKMLSRLEA